MTKHLNPDDEGWTGLVDRPEWKISYMNSVVQCLYHTQSLRDFFLSNRFENELNLLQLHQKDDKTTYIQNEMIKDPELGKRALKIGAIICMMWSSKFSSLRLEPFRKIFVESTKDEEGWKELGTQQKAMNFFCYLMFLMNEDLRDDNTKNSVINQLFMSEVLNECVCSNCKHDSKQIIYKYHISIANNNGNYDLFEWPGQTNFHTECKNMITDNQICNGQVTSKEQWLTSFPNILVIELERFDEQDNRIDDPYEIHPEISINELVHEEIRKTFAKTEDGQEYEVLYALYAVIHHSGGHTLQDGNYITFVQYITDVSQIGTSNGEWRKYQDNEVTHSDKDEAIDGNDAQRDVYALFYRLDIEDDPAEQEGLGEQEGSGVQEEFEVQQVYEVQDRAHEEPAIDDDDSDDDQLVF